MKKELISKTFTKMPTLETSRLLLRRMKTADTDDMYDYACRPEVTKYLLWSPHQSKRYTADYLRYINSRYRMGEFYDWAVIHKESGKMIGTCGFTRFEPQHDLGEIGYVLNPDFHGQGLGTEAVRCVMGFGFETLGLHRIEAKFMQGNTPSLRVMEKLGMTFEGYHRDGMLVKGEYKTIGICAVLKNEWHKLNDEK